MTEKKLDEILFVVKGMEAKIDKISEALVDFVLKKPEPKQETVKKELDVTETIEAEVGVITAKAVAVLNSDGSKICWIPKSAIKNLDKIAIEQGKRADLLIHDWFQAKIQWVKNEPRDN